MENIFSKFLYCVICLTLLVGCEKQNIEELGNYVKLDINQIQASAWERSYRILVFADQPWSVDSLPDWVTVNPSSGTTNDTISVLVSFNGISSPRIAKIRFLGIQARDSLVISQNGMPTSSAVLYSNGITRITEGSVVAGGTVVSDGGSPIIARGVCWSSTPEPTINDHKTSESIDVGVFESLVTGLKSAAGYYLRAYCLNSNGIKYGTQEYFTTKSLSINTTLGSLILCYRADCGGIIETEGTGATLTTRGVCYSTFQNPTIDSAHVNSSTGGKGSFIVSVYGLKPSTTYYVRAYAKNESGAYYGEQETFTTMDGVTVIDPPVMSEITTSSAECRAKIVTDGGISITARGVCWSTSPLPTLNDNATHDGSYMGTFLTSIKGLSPATTYYVRTYGINSAGTFYGDATAFTTQDGIATLTTNEVTAIGLMGAVCGGNVTANGGSPITQRGICWSTSANPTIDDSRISSGTGNGSFSVTMTNLSTNTTYYVRSYAKNVIKTSYGEVRTFTTKSPNIENFENNPNRF